MSAVEKLAKYGMIVGGALGAAYLCNKAIKKYKKNKESNNPYTESKPTKKNRNKYKKLEQDILKYGPI